MKLLGIDYGEKHVGLALSEGVIAAPLRKTYTNEALSIISEVCKKEAVEICVLGLPEGRLKPKVVAFSESLKKIVQCSVIFWDETLSSHSAQSALRQTALSSKRKKDKEHETAAALILESYLEFHTKK